MKVYGGTYVILFVERGWVVMNLKTGKCYDQASPDKCREFIYTMLGAVVVGHEVGSVSNDRN